MIRKPVFPLGMVASSLVFGLSTMAAPAQNSESATQPVKLRTTTPPALVDCDPVTQSPCMALGVTPVDAAGNPAPVTLPPTSGLAGAFTLRDQAREIKPFYASAGLGPDAGQRSNVSLVLIDISGSMNQPAPGSTSRFAAVKAALTEFLSGMQEGTDRIAIVPFESHNVVSTINAAVYATSKADALAQLNALPAPAPKNNTALYQAVFSGVRALQDEVAALDRRGQNASGLQPHLIVMTDGKNEVMPGDDPALLNGELGLQQAAAQVGTSHLDVLGIGFGDQAAIDSAAMQRLSRRFFYAADATQLLAALHVSRPATIHELHLLWLLPENSRRALVGRDPEWTPEFRLVGGSTLPGEPARLISPAIGAPVYDRRATAPELQALITTQPPSDSGWSVVLLYYLLSLAACALVLILWFWIPRLVWGGRYVSALPTRSKRWSSDRGVTSASGVQIRSTPTPAGFDSPEAALGPLHRSAAQTTQLQPRGELSRTRLTFDQK